jgi:hypothetical protein
MVQEVIDSLPPLSTLSSAPDLGAALRGTDNLAKSREDFLSWLCLSFRGFLVAAPNRLHIPSMPNAMQFILLNSCNEREKAFAAHSHGSTGGAVFHGTHPSRLFPILLGGLKAMSGTAGQVNGAAIGSGVYCGDEPGTSWSYAGQIGQNWRNSSIGNMKIMLACELAGYTSTSVHVVSPQERLLVRYVFLLPAFMQAPARRHVDPALSTAFSRIRSGM